MVLSLRAVLLWFVPALLVSAQSSNGSAPSFEQDPGLLWSTYSPQLYFGIKPRLPKSLSAGLMWFGLNDWEGIRRIHHTSSSASPSADGLQSYTYTSHIPRVGSTQKLIDSRNGLNIQTGFVNLPTSGKAGAKLGQGWGARVQVIEEHGDERISGLWYIALEGEGSLRLVEQDNSEHGLGSPIVLLGQTPELGPFKITLTDHESNEHISEGAKAADFAEKIGKTSWAGLRAPADELWKAKEIVQSLLHASAQKIVQKYGKSTPPNAADLPDVAYTFGMNLPNEHQGPFGSNFYVFQKTWGGEGGWDVLYEEGDFSPFSGSDDEQPVEEGKRQVISNALDALAVAFDEHFENTLPLSSPYNSPAHTSFAQEVTSNLLGGVGYFHGRSLVDRSFAHEYDEQPEYEEGEEGVRETDERELLTATPSRSFFPRGFYWDEGFHLALIGEWDQDLSLEILKSWVDLIDEDGWVGREQILGEEARSKVPAEFRVQYPTYANPPTLTMALTSFISRLQAAESSALLSSQLGLDTTAPLPLAYIRSKYLQSPEKARAYLLSVYPALRRHYLWFRQTQKGQLKEWGRRPPSRAEAYRWRGRTDKHVLTSGLDDYPRAVPPSVGELHVDLMSWMGFFARTMKEIAGYLGEEDDEEEYARNEKNILANLDALHWSEEDQMYCDVTVDDDDDSVPVCHAGYVSLFPFFLGLLPPSSPHLGPVLALLRNPAKLWSPYGIRSLSKDHPLFGTDEDYWRSPVWMPFQFLALQSLYKIYMPQPGPHQETARKIYTELRSNLIDNIFKEYQRTGYIWEQYNSLTGEGARSHPFTGWTALIANIMAEKY
ncbi:glycoside hydrolase family 63 protein [Phaffia rhodozyma]|uniref:Mannosyl-oligosaccharide glucosidase n=1 Tax=Phaffia rhodozyma TaxID=264483 RepID=A0A0F7SFA3_PHARH|nr:glycoside hydrolase family 63 protein [Phaffia rhodozyma]